MFPTGRAIQSAILFSTLLGVLFLWEVNGLVPSFVFDFVATGWVLFVIDSALTFIRPQASYALGFVLAILALSTSLPQTAHYAFVQEGEVLAATTFIAGTVAQALLVVLVPLHFFLRRRRANPGLVQGK